MATSQGSSSSQIPALVGSTSAFFYAGVHFAASQLTLPILYRLPSATSTSVFNEFFHRGIPVVIALATTSAASNAAASYLGRTSGTIGGVKFNPRVSYAVAAAFAVSPLIFTRAVMVGPIDKLLELSTDEQARKAVGDSGVVALLRTWFWQNMVRSGLAFTGGLIGLVTYVAESHR